MDLHYLHMVLGTQMWGREEGVKFFRKWLKFLKEKLEKREYSNREIAKKYLVLYRLLL